MSKKKRLAAKYRARRIAFALLLLLLLALGAFGLWRLLSRAEAGPESSSGSGSSGSQSLPPATQTGGEPEEGISRPDLDPAPVEPQGPVIDKDDWRLVLINPTHAIEKELDIEFDEVNGYKFDKRVAGKVRELIAAAKEDGYSLAIVSGYRTMDRSRMLYANKVAEYQAMGYDEATAKVEAARWVAPPGTSEHHSGLAMDIVSGDYYTKYNDLVEAFENEPEAVWLKENCARFGFVLRFPKDKTDITGINFEPWHFRYVGEEHAQVIMEQGLCLEEYLGVLD
ncbi:MAG: M15 family metallopeptidase [Angelakisella sp.]|nr:M15 family metallopeptidase [Angelakisella sp.]MCI9529045.1 M15 family metallopeptidase [Angelakisella sp.]